MHIWCSLALKDYHEDRELEIQQANIHPILTAIRNKKSLEPIEAPRNEFCQIKICKTTRKNTSVNNGVKVMFHVRATPSYRGKRTVVQ